MARDGQLARQQWGKTDCVLVGFGSYSGTVIADQHWEAIMEEMQMPRARLGSIEEELHREVGRDALIVFDQAQAHPVHVFNERILHRAIGVVYDSASERTRNYVPTVLAGRYDAFIYIDKTSALHPLSVQGNASELPATYPFAF